MHPHEIGSENPSKDEHIDCTEYEATETDPRKARQSLKNSVMELYAGYCPPWQESSDETKRIDHLRTQHVIPAV